MKILAPLGRLLFSLIFITSGLRHFDPGMQAYAAAQGVPAFMVMISGAMALTGGLLIAVGWRARLGGALIALFLLPVTLTMHRFWGDIEPQIAMQQQAHFMKNLSMLGGALLIAYFGAGPFSLDNRRTARQASLRQPFREPARVGR